MFLVEDEPSGVEMTFLGADTNMLAAWADHAERMQPRLESLLQETREAVRSAAWVGPDREAFLGAFSSQVEHSGARAVELLGTLGRRARSDAEEQDAASAADGSAAVGPHSGGDRSSPKPTEDSGDPVAVPDDLQEDVDDPAAIRRDAERIVQGGMGDCFFLAPLAAVARTHPDLLEENVWFEDGQYHVRFYEKDFLGRVQERVVTVDPEVAGNGVRDADGDISTMSIFETAYASYRGGYGEIEEGGHAADPMFTLTGQDTRTYDVEPSVDQLRDELAAGNVVVADTGPRDGEGGLFDPESWSDRDGAVPRDTVSTHVYVVTDVREDGRVVLQNPWGPDGGFQADDDVHKPGELVLTEEEYRERFQNVTVTEGPES